MKGEKPDPWTRQVKEYLRIINLINYIYMSNINKNQLQKEIKEYERAKWKIEMGQKSMLELYNRYKINISEEKWYDNTFGSVLLYKCCANTVH